MKFQDKFKPGDIICSDRFHNGLCMVVDFSPYYEMDFETFQMMVDLNFPERIGVKTNHGTFFSPWNKDSLMKFWIEKKGA